MLNGGRMELHDQLEDTECGNPLLAELGGQDEQAAALDADGVRNPFHALELAAVG